jgi:molybdopterin synthase sulfur carrier subunit
MVVVKYQISKEKLKLRTNLWIRSVPIGIRLENDLERSNGMEMNTNMKKYTVLAFGIAKDILGGRQCEIELPGNTVAALRTALVGRYPALAGLRSLMIAVNSEYAEDGVLLEERDEIALIPPVSGG